MEQKAWKAEQRAQKMIQKAKERDHEYVLKKMEYESRIHSGRLQCL